MLSLEQAFEKERNSSSLLAQLLLPFCRFRYTQNVVLKLIRRIEGGEFWSNTLRRFLAEHYDVQVGKYSYGPCLKPGRLPRGTRIGNYCSIAEGLAVFRRNHPIDRISQNALFYNAELGLTTKDTIEKDEENPLTIGHDVWIGYRSIITPSCKTIGNGAIIASGSVVTKDIPPFTVWAGTPAKQIKERFPKKIAADIQQSRWWNKSIEELPLSTDLFFSTLHEEKLKSLGEFLSPVS